MKRIRMTLVTLGIILPLLAVQCKKAENPLLTEFNTPYNVPPFSDIKVEHYEPAFDEAIKQAKQEVEAIVSNDNPPSFENTIEALEYSGMLLTRVNTIFRNLASANTNPDIQAVAQTIAPKLSSYRDDVMLNEMLFERISTVYEEKETLSLNQEQSMLLEKTYRKFVRGGAKIPEEKRGRFREINGELSKLNLKFGDNVLAETNNFELLIDDKKDLAGLPKANIEAAASSAKDAGHEGQWLFTLHKPSLIPFLQYADNRNLREKIYQGYFMRGDNNNEHDNKEIVNKIVNLRIERAQLLGYQTHAHYILEENMASNPETVYEFLDNLWQPALDQAKIETYDIQQMIDDDGKDYRLASWDWWYYTERIRKERFDLDEEMLKPYFSLETVKEGIFNLTNKLFGLKYEKLSNDIPIYHPEVEIYKVMEADNTFVGLLYMDFHPRNSKRGGAWMTSYQKQHISAEGEPVTPIISIVCNFTRPSGNTPALLSIEEAQTFFHEFGHALHGLLSDCTYPSLAGTSVPRDFVELPSQIMENWSTDPEFLMQYAVHYETGVTIPNELIDKMLESSTFNQGFITGEYLAAAYLDMDFHTLTEQQDLDVNKFEAESMQRIGLIDEIIPRYRSTYFQHIYSGGYSSGYYSYIWSGVLDTDAYEAFKETGDIFDPETATRYRRHILERGGTEEPMKLYIKFRGDEPSQEPLLRKRGLI